MRILIIRLLGFGDVASILVPATRLVRCRYPDADIDVLTFEAGVQIMELVPEVKSILSVGRAQWPNELLPAVESFSKIGDVVISNGYDIVFNLDTWFMPCFLARLLKDIGLDVRGNFLRLSVGELFSRLEGGRLTQGYFSNVSVYLDSTFPNMSDWTRPWWRENPDTGYPDFYLGHCCGFDGPVDMGMDVEPDFEFAAAANGKRIVALSLSGSRRGKRYGRGEDLARALENAGYLVWGRFDGSVPLVKTLARLRVSDLLVGVPTSTQWLARSVGCPTLLIPGSLPPEILRPEACVDRVEPCQYCHQMACPLNLDFPCLDVSPFDIAAKAVDFLSIPGTNGLARGDSGPRL